MPSADLRFSSRVTLDVVHGRVMGLVNETHVQYKKKEKPVDKKNVRHLGTGPDGVVVLGSHLGTGSNPELVFKGSMGRCTTPSSFSVTSNKVTTNYYPSVLDREPS